MKKILMVFTGGTIGSQLNDHTINIHQDAGFKLIRLFQHHYPDAKLIQFTCLSVPAILSENLHPQFWQQVIATIESEELSHFDGIIITHGTDTLAFSAAAFGIYFNYLTIPLLLVSSNLPLDDPNANGLQNLICAVNYIRQRQEPGVFVPYQNPGQAMQIHIGTRLSSCLPLSSDFISVQSRPYLLVEHDNFLPLHPLAFKNPTYPRLKNQFARILLIKPYPGLNYDHFNLDHVDAVLHDLYHSGTACTTEHWGQQHNLLQFIQQCQQRKIPLYLAPILKTDAIYSTTQQLITQGAHVIWNMSLESAYAKLAMAYATFTDPQALDDFLANNISWEQI